jgi:hypothetical protein
MDLGEGDEAEASFLGGGVAGAEGGEVVEAVEFLEAAGDGGFVDAEVAGDSAQGPAAEVAEAVEATVGVGVEAEVGVEVVVHISFPLLYGHFLAFFRVRG